MNTLEIAPRFGTIPVQMDFDICQCIPPPRQPGQTGLPLLCRVIMLMTFCWCNWYTKGVFNMHFTRCFNIIASESKRAMSSQTRSFLGTVIVAVVKITYLSTIALRIPRSAAR